MQEASFVPYLDWFEHFVQQHLAEAGDNAHLVERKQRHTMRVVDHVLEIIKESGANPALANAMKIAALLHDAGRFPQLLDTDTYDDSAGYDHGRAGAQLLARTDLFDELDMDARGIILSVVQYHNRAYLPPELGPDARLALEVIRDADKLDAVRNNLRYFNSGAPHSKVLKSGLTWHETKYSPQVLDLAMTRQLIPFNAIGWSNDFILFLCCWIYDLHFNYSFVHLKESGNFQALLDRLPDTPVFAPLKTRLMDDLDWIIVKS